MNTVDEMNNLASDLRLRAIRVENDAQARYGAQAGAYLQGVAQGLRDAARRVEELASMVDAVEDVRERRAEDREYYAAKAVAAGVR